MYSSLGTDDDGLKDLGGISGAVFVGLFLVFIGALVWWIYAMVHFKFPEHYILVVLALGIFLDPVVGLIAAYILRTK